ncbi:MAG: DUF1289 domain-containing protein [Marinagarivorans sp.]|nr:DUF1289 domain-containing protein [Marinagarivorans sp.]
MLQEPQSPCVRNCCLNDADICMGCFRSLEEIKLWSASDIELKQAILIAAKARRLDRENRDPLFE